MRGVPMQSSYEKIHEGGSKLEKEHQRPRSNLTGAATLSQRPRVALRANCQRKLVATKLHEIWKRRYEPARLMAFDIGRSHQDLMLLAQ